MRAVAAGYLDYKDCELEGKALDTLEAWSVSRVYRRETQYLRETQLGISKAMLHLGGDLEGRIESIQELWSGIADDIVGVAHKTRDRSEEGRYKEIFGDVTEEDIDNLTQHLDDKSLVIEQDQMSKDQAMKRLEEELGSRFRNRIT